MPCPDARALGNAMNYWVVIYRFSWLVLVLLLVIGLACIFIPKFREVNELQDRRNELRRKVQATEQATMALRVKQERFSSDPEYVERIAKEAGMIKPTEILFKFTNDNSRAAGSAQ